MYTFCRNRLAEIKAHLLPFGKSDDDETREAIMNLGLLPHEVEYMRTNKTLELPPNFFRQLRGKTGGRRIEYLEYVAFKLRTTFPHNIALMSSGEVVYCTKFERKGDRIFICGHPLQNVSAYNSYIFYSPACIPSE
jgi:hypothetical protein